MFAEKLAYESKMDFALLSGPSFEQFDPSDAVIEIKKFFHWANGRRRGLLLFIDECDSFLSDRNSLDSHHTQVLNEFINQTGCETRNFMIIFETNRPWVIDPAIQSRISQSIEFTSPSSNEINSLLMQAIDKYIKEDGFSFFFSSF